MLLGHVIEKLNEDMLDEMRQLKVVFANGTLRCRVRVIQKAVDMDQSSSQFLLNRQTRPNSSDHHLTLSWCTVVDRQSISKTQILIETLEDA